MDKDFPIFSAGTIFKPFSGALGQVSPRRNCTVQIDYPCRLNGMTIDSANVAVKGSTSFPAGEICFTIDKFVHVELELNDSGELLIYEETKRKSIVRHACIIMSKALNIEPAFNVSVRLDDGIKKHSGFGSSGAIIGAVCVAINELCGGPIDRLSLLRYMADNYGEEIGDDEHHLKLVQCVGGSVGSGLTDGGITIIAGNAVPIFSQNYDADILVAVPKDFRPKTAKEMMELEEANLARFVDHGEKYAHEIAYNLVHEGMPLLKVGDISGICKIIYRHRFEMGSIQNCSFVYPKITKIAEDLKYLYSDGYCELISMSSVGPALFFVLDGVNNHIEECKKAIKRQNLELISTSVYNSTYKVNIIERTSNEAS